MDLMEEIGYEGHFCYSTVKKGYSGVCMFVKKNGGSVGAAEEEHNASLKKGKKKQATIGSFFGSTKKNNGNNDDIAATSATPSTTASATSKEATTTTTSSSSTTTADHYSTLQPIKITNELGIPAHDGEGRVITAEFPLFHLTNVYVPNSGQKLDRLSYRTQQWDADFLRQMKQFEIETNKPVIWLGDLNVAHNEKDTWNEGAKHLVKSAGTTPEERASFEMQLEGGFVDAFRYLHPEGRGHYSYWSQRAGNREPNQGLRLDYFICSEGLMEGGAAGGDGGGEEKEKEKKAIVRDSYMVPDQLGSDHCPIVLVSLL